MKDLVVKNVEEIQPFLCDISIEVNILNKPTAFKAVYESVKAGPTIAYLCEYDALPEIGHGCGHNMIGTMSAGAAIMTGAEVEISNYEISYDNMNTNKALSNVFMDNLSYIGITEIEPSISGTGSIDMGNVSHVGHSIEFRDATLTKKAHQALFR